MATIKAKFRQPANEGKAGRIYYQITHNRQVRQVSTAHCILPVFWDTRRSRIVVPREGEEAARLGEIRNDIIGALRRFSNIVRRLEESGHDYSADEIGDAYLCYVARFSMFAFMDAAIESLRRNGRVRTAETYRTALNSIRKFREGRDIMLDCLDDETVADYAAWLKGRGLVANSISFYMRILRAAYNRAADAGGFENRHPFRHVYTGVAKTVKRALPLRAVRRIKTLDLSPTPHLEYARDMFLMSFYLRGMSFIDMAFLRKSDCRDGHIIYRRRKTGQQLTIAWTAEMQHILDKYPANDTDYLLPIIRHSSHNERSVYRNAGYNINNSLKMIARRLGMDFHLTMYVARHSWASAAHSAGIPVSVISEGMGHDSERTTRIYLAQLDTSVVDRANARIIKSLG